MCRKRPRGVRYLWEPVSGSMCLRIFNAGFGGKGWNSHHLRLWLAPAFPPHSCFLVSLPLTPGRTHVSGLGIKPVADVLARNFHDGFQQQIS